MHRLAERSHCRDAFRGIDYYRKLQQAQVDVTLKVFERVVHGFFEINYDKPSTDAERIQKEEKEACFAYLRERMETLWSRVE